MNEILSMDISSGRGYSDEDCRMYESALCAAVFRTDNPVARCIHREVNLIVCLFLLAASLMDLRILQDWLILFS